MGMTNTATGTRIDEVGEGIYRISTPVAAIPGGFSFNQYLLVDDEPLLFHTGMRRLFPPVRGAIESVLPIARLTDRESEVLADGEVHATGRRHLTWMDARGRRASAGHRRRRPRAERSATRQAALFLARTEHDGGHRAPRRDRAVVARVHAR